MPLQNGRVVNEAKASNFSKDSKLLPEEATPNVNETRLTWMPQKSISAVISVNSQDGPEDFSQQTYLGLFSTSATPTQY